jgi:hypothetical protein
MASGKGGSSTTTVAVPEYIEKAAQRNLTRADAISQIGYVPYYGPDVAAFSPMQNAAFKNTADAASAFGMAAPSGSNVYGTMGAPTDYGNGLLGYSSQPLYQGSLNQLRQNAPAQYNAMTNMFVNPQTGMVNGAAPQVFDYTAMPTSYQQAAQAAQADRDAETARAVQVAALQPASGGSSVTPYNSFTSGPISAALPGGVNDPNLTSPINQVIAQATSPDRSGPLAPATSPVPPPKPAAPAPVVTSSGGSDRDYVSPLAPATSPRPQPKPTTTSSSSGGSSSGGGGCVVATHAVSSGAFTPHMKREAVVWCMEVLHGKWWGEAIRRGYRHLGRKKIEQGKAHEHYAEFRKYIAFANGSKRDLRGALTFTLRTAQFFVVGMMNMEA